MENEIVELELVHKYRPKLFKHVIGQDDQVRVLTQMVKNSRVPHALLFTGPSGVGKTTLARILATKLECLGSDLSEINAADFRGVDTVRDIRTRMNLHPMFGKTRIWIIDECQSLTKDAQNALLKNLEDTPKHVHFMLATTDPAKLLKTIHTRCTEIKLKSITNADLEKLVVDVAVKENIKLGEDTAAKIVEHSLESARLALVLLNKIIGIEDAEEQLSAVERNASSVESIALARALLNNSKWSELAAIIKKIDDEPEGVRRMILAYMSNVMLGGGKMTARAHFLLEEFRDHFYDTGRPGLVRACYASTLQR